MGSKKLTPFKMSCPRCIHFQEETGVCKEFRFDIRKYPNKFLTKCNGDYFIVASTKVAQEVENTAMNIDAATIGTSKTNCAEEIMKLEMHPKIRREMQSVTKPLKLKHPDTGEIRNLKVGWSWTLFFFSTIYGIPLFFRGLKAWGWLMFCLGVLQIIRNFYSPNEVNFLDYSLLVSSVFSAIFFGFRGNALTLKQWQKNGWVVADNQSIKRP